MAEMVKGRQQSKFDNLHKSQREKKRRIRRELFILGNGRGQEALSPHNKQTNSNDISATYNVSRA